MPEFYPAAVNAPKRIQLQRTKGWRKPGGAVVVARPTKWGNPFHVSNHHPQLFVHDDLHVHFRIAKTDDDATEIAQQRAVDLYRSWIESNTIVGLTELPGRKMPPRLARIRGQIIGEIKTLAGRDLACWCPPEMPCHTDVLLEIANA